MKDRVFLDTNIFIYALTKPKNMDCISKRDKAISLLERLINESRIFISIQIINELHINMVKKFKIDDSLVFQTLQDNIVEIASVKSLDYDTYNIAFDVRKKYKT
jgi:predicted nucleic acid-binding protein